MHFYRCADFAAPGAYRDVEAFFADLAEVFRQEIGALARAGCRYIQIDEVAVALLCDPTIRAQVERAGGEPEKLVDLYIDGINQAVAGCSPDTVVGVHMCRGNLKGHYLAAGGYQSVAESFFARTNVNHFLLEYDTPRAGDFAPLRFVPKNKGVVLGLVSSKVPALEDLGELRRRVDEAVHCVDLDRLAISPQCGFASTVAGNPLTQAEEEAKLRLVVNAAAAIWQ
jgi:5-methyltetrahydropteroyltriglutamate--homocysteine methyltransferase